MEELRDLYDANGIKTDKTYRKGDNIPNGYYPMVVMVAIRNTKGEFLMQDTVTIYLFGKKYDVPSDLTIMCAMEYAGYQLVRGCGCAVQNCFC